MASYLFSLHKLNSYRDNASVIQALGGVQLLNFKEFSKWYKDPDPKILPVREAALTSYYPTEELLEEERLESDEIAMAAAINNLTEGVCQDKIASHYLEGSLKKAYDSRFFDLLVAVIPGYEELNDTTAYPMSTKQRSREKIGKVVGFIIAQYGECKTHPNAYAVNLICTRSIDGYFIKGALLLGAYMYCIKQTEHAEQLGVLELAFGYDNIGGFFAYTKMGFDKDYTLVKEGCFEDYENLPMSVNLQNYSLDNIIGLATGIAPRPLSDVKDDTGLYALGLPQKGNSMQSTLQNKIASNANLLYLLNLATMKDPRLGVYSYLYKNYGIANDKISQNIIDTQNLLNKLKNEFVNARTDYNSSRSRTRSGKLTSSSFIGQRSATVNTTALPRRSSRIKSSNPYGGRKSKRIRKNKKTKRARQLKKKH
jgi:hypothetical protein